jgi:hypothetical protein
MLDMEQRRWPTKRTWRFWLVGAPALLIGCGQATASDGGQSGTDGADDPRFCLPATTVDVGLDETIPTYGLAIDELLSQLAAPVVMQGLWYAPDERTELVLQSSSVSARYTSRLLNVGGPCDWSAEVAAVVHVSSADGLVDTIAPATISIAQDGSALLESVLPEIAADSFKLMDVRYALQIGLRSLLGDIRGVKLGAMIGRDELINVGIYRDSDLLGFWTNEPELVPLPPGKPEDYAPPAALAQSCDGAEAFRSPSTAHYVPFSSEEAARRGMTGNWARCLDNVMSAHVGFQIQPDGSWNELVLDGERIVPRYGFGHEGVIDLQELGVMGGGPGAFQLELLPENLHARSSNEALVFPSKETSWPDSVYLPLTAPVVPSEADPHPYRAGERAGGAGCLALERGVTPLFDEVSQRLTGEYTLCTGELAGGVERIRFLPNERIELLGPGGAVLETEHYTFDAMNHPHLSLIIGVLARQWRIVAANAPAKLQISEATTSSRTKMAVFSALP